MVADNVDFNIPTLDGKNTLYDDVDVRKKDADQKRMMKYLADKMYKVPKKQIEVGYLLDKRR